MRRGVGLFYLPGRIVAAMGFGARTSRHQAYICPFLVGVFGSFVLFFGLGVLILKNALIPQAYIPCGFQEVCARRVRIS